MLSSAKLVLRPTSFGYLGRVDRQRVPNNVVLNTGLPNVRGKHGLYKRYLEARGVSKSVKTRLNSWTQAHHSEYTDQYPSGKGTRGVLKAWFLQ